MARQPASGGFGRIAGLFTIAFLAGVVVLALLGHFGLPEAVLGTVLGGASLVTFAVIGIAAGTIQTSDFYLADRALPAVVNGVATAAAMMSGAVVLGLAGGYFADGSSAAVFVIGLALGFLVLAAGIAPYFRKSGAFGAADFLGVRYGGRLVRLVAVVAVVAALLPALAATISTAASLAATLLDVSPQLALAIVVGVTVASTALGGMRAITLTAIVQYIVLALAFLAPVAIVSSREFGLPLPYLTYGLALKDAALLVLASGRDLAAAVPSRLLPFSTSGGLAALGTIVSLAAGVATLPHLLLRSATVTGADQARRAAGWSLFFVLAIVLAAPAYAAFARLVILREVADVSLDGLPDWIFTFGQLGLARICGVDAVSVDAILAACPGDTLPASQLAIGGDAIVLAAPAIFDLPYAFSALISAGALAATLAAANAMVFAIGSAVGHDLYGGVIDKRATAGRLLIVTRLAIVLAVAAAVWLGYRHGDDAFRLALSAISLSAGGLFPAVILAVWWKRANAPGAIAGVVIGTLVTAVIIVGHVFPDATPAVSFGFTDLTAAIAGMIAGFIATVGVSLATPAPTVERQAIVDAIRRPGGEPFVQESESL
jgi:cation/acetate symporter